jgi:hypothetical protein
MVIGSPVFPSAVCTMADFVRTSVFDVAPANAVSVRVYWRLFGNDQDAPYGWLARPMFEEATALQTAPSAWSEGATGVAANASAVTVLQARVTSAEGVNTSQAASIVSLNSTVGGHTSSITSLNATTANTNGVVNAMSTLVLDVNGYVSGFKSVNDGTTATFDVVADKIRFIAPGGGARTEFSSGNWRVYDAAGVLRVRMGIW